MLRTLVRVVAAAGLAAAAYVALPATPASAATCATADGVTVVADFHELGGGVQTACVPDGGGDSASELFPAAGFSLSYVQRQPGFVCRVSGKPADDPCVSTPPADAYWGLWWSDGESGHWTYSSTGASGLNIPDGGYVAFSWNGSSGNVPPGISPAPHPTPSATPTHEPTHAPTHAPTHSSSPSPSQQTTAASPTTSDSASASPSKEPKPDGKSTRSEKPSPTATSAAPSESPSESPADAVPASADPTAPDDGGLPAWVAPAAIVVLFGAAGAAALIRRRRGTPGS